MQHFIVELTFKGALTDADKQAQRAFLQKITDDGHLILAGVFPDKPGQGLALLRAETRQAAEACYREAPVVKSDLVNWVLRDFTLTMGMATGLRTS